MTELSLNLPVVGEKDTTAEPKVTTAFTEIQTVINGKIDTNNLESHKALIQNNNSYAAEKSVTKAEIEAGVEISATRLAWVMTSNTLATFSVGGIAATGLTEKSGCLVPPTQKIKGETALATIKLSVLLL